MIKRFFSMCLMTPGMPSFPTGIFNLPKTVVFICLLLLSHVGFSIENDPSANRGNKVGLLNKKNKNRGFNVKLSPAIFWRTLIIESELPLNSHFSVGLNLYGKLGGTDAKKQYTQEAGEAYYSPGFAAELAFKYYFRGEAPEGLYIQVNGGYSTLFYQDGNTRPYVVHNHWRKQGELFEKPQPYYAGVGVGYQLIVLPDHLIANVLIGVQGNRYKENQFPLSFYITPSIGYKF